MEHTKYEAKYLNAKIASIVKRLDAIAKDTNEVAKGVIAHAILHGNTTPANNLLKAFGKSLKATNLKRYATAHGPFTIGTIEVDGKKIKAFKLNTEKAKAMLAEHGNNIDLFVDNLPDFVDEQAESVPQDFDFMAALMNLVKRADKKKSEAGPNDKFDGLDMVRNFLDNNIKVAA